MEAELDLQKTLIAILAKLGEVTLTKEEFVNPRRDNEPIVGFMLSVTPTRDAIILKPMTLAQTEQRMMIAALEVMDMPERSN